ncbi:hypothetical protein C8J56DRAFT_923182 [Mycena floridula]|nr:hypothetical protein C8J56DRAFT_923182 [Mycena floridula]
MQFKVLALYTLFTLAAAGPIAREAKQDDVAVGKAEAAPAAKADPPVAGKIATAAAAAKAKAAKGAAALKGAAAAAKAGKKGTATATAVDSTATDSSNSTSVDNSSNSTATGVSSAASATRTRACDQGDQSLAAALQANVVIGLGLQASVATLQGLANGGAAADVTDAQTRLAQFASTSDLQLQTAAGIADDDSLAQPQLQQLQASIADQQKSIASLTGGAADAATLQSLADSFVASTGLSQDGASNAVIDCFLPLTAVSA